MVGESRCGAQLALLLVVLLCLLVPFWSGIADVGSSASSAELDGMSFVGKLGPDGKPLDRDDILFFRDGQFWSKNCVACSFQPGAYFTRHADGGIEFQGVLESVERGRFSYIGVVRDGRVNARINWRKERWYWSIDKDFRFEGELAPDIDVPSVQQASQLASSAGPKPQDCRL